MKSENKKPAIESFKTDSVPKIVIKNSVPALVAMLMVIVYNLADTFFLGLTHNDLYVTAVSFGTPLFMIFMSLGTLFGVGGTSVISRALGAGKTEYARKASSFCMWASVAVGAVMMALLWIFLDDVTVMLGAKDNSIELTKEYLGIVIGCGIFSMLSHCFSCIVRTEGKAMKAMTGTLIGNLLNIVLDAVFILVFKWGVAGAAIATVIGNVVAAAYYFVYFLRGKSTLSIRIKDFSMKEGILKGVLAVGISASLVNLLASVSSIVVNAQLSKYADGNMLVAGYGVTSKIIMIVTLIGIGIGSGVQPFLGFCYGAGDKQRLVKGIRFSSCFGVLACFAVSAICFILAEPIVKVFLTDFNAIEYGVSFTKILMTTAWLIGAFAICQIALQGIGAASSALFTSVFRQGILFIPLVFLMKSLLGIYGLIWAQPITDVISLVVIVLILWMKIRKTDFEQIKQNNENSVPDKN